jgi:transposase
LGKTRWVVERTIAWLHQFRRLRVRYERLPSIHEAVPQARRLPDLLALR